MEPQLRALGLATTLIRGVPSLSNPHTICAQGEKLTSEKCRILKLLGVQMAVSDHMRRRSCPGVPYQLGLALVKGDWICTW